MNFREFTGLCYSHITQTDRRPTIVGEQKLGKSGDIGLFIGQLTTFLSKHQS